MKTQASASAAVDQEVSKAVRATSNNLDTILISKGVTEANLISAICAIGEATARIAVLLQNNVDHTYAGTQNNSGDEQLNLDLDCDRAAFRAIRESGVFVLAASEETPVETAVAPQSLQDEEGPLYSVGFDPLDGSSIIDANFSVGSIFGIWPGKGLLGRSGREQVASVVSVYGPRTSIWIALPSKSRDFGQGDLVFEATLVRDQSQYEVSRHDVKLKPSKKIFAPGNLRAVNDNQKYDALLKHWISERYTLRYTGGMVPDVYHAFAKAGGVFCNVSSEKARAKLRLLYEVAPIGLMVECADGLTTHEFEDKSVLDIKIDDLDKRLGVCFGSKNEVQKYKQFMFKE